MDWEKQDNELRELMNSSNFLPEGEIWDAGAGWRKLQQKKQPAQNRWLFYWMQLAAAACVVGILGFVLWWIQQDDKVGKIDNVVKNNEVENIKGGKVETIEQSIVQQHPPNTDNQTKQNSHNSFNKETQPLNKKTQQKMPGNNLQSLVNNKPESKVLNNKDVEPMAVIDSKNEMDMNSVNAMVTITPPIDSKSDITSIAPLKKPKIRVVHYNELNGMNATAPPVFVLTKKSEAEWENLAVQSVNTKGLHPYSLKIDISPAPKKSL